VPMNQSASTKAGDPRKRVSGEADRRASERFSFSAVAELVDVASHTRITARVSDISTSGCYLDVINVFGPGAKARITIRHANLQLDALATVVYSLPGMGMGVAFDSMTPEMASVLERWIALATGEIAPQDAAPEINRMIQNYPRVERHILGRLIGLMMRKTMLTREEGTNLLDELLRENPE
jgi:hypothetical protein